MFTSTVLEHINDLTVYTGNIIALNVIKGKPNQNASEELMQSIKITFSNSKLPKETELIEKALQITRDNDDVLQKIAETDRKDLKIGVKLFLNHVDPNGIEQAINSIFQSLQVETIDNLILSYNNSKQNDDIMPQVKTIWKNLENYVKTKKISQIGVSELDEQQFKTLYDFSEIKPSIIQINLSVCCVVPPSLQEFCNSKGIQLLTHSDPSDILSNESLNELFGENSGLDVYWTVRFQIHILARGVLTSKGYIVNLKKRTP